MPQQTLVLANASLSETAVQSARDPGPSHVCEPDESSRECSMLFECKFMREWRQELNGHACLLDRCGNGRYCQHMVEWARKRSRGARR